MQIAIPEAGIRAFKDALEILNASNIPYAIGGAFAMYQYSGMWRNTNDLDLYLERKSLTSATHALASVGFEDSGEMAAGDHEWIYHAIKNGTMVDLIWQPPSHLTPIDASVYERGAEGTFLDIPVRFLPPDELVLSKLFTMNRHRCDWPDVFHVVRSTADCMDWHHLINKVGDNWPVLLSFIILFDWTYPSESHAIPQDMRNELIKRKLELSDCSNAPTRESILDPWIYTRPLTP